MGTLFGATRTGRTRSEVCSTGSVRQYKKRPAIWQGTFNAKADLRALVADVVAFATLLATHVIVSTGMKKERYTSRRKRENNDRRQFFHVSGTYRSIFCFESLSIVKRPVHPVLWVNRSIYLPSNKHIPPKSGPSVLVWGFFCLSKSGRSCLMTRSFSKHNGKK